MKASWQEEYYPQEVGTKCHTHIPNMEIQNLGTVSLRPYQTYNHTLLRPCHWTLHVDSTHTIHFSDHRHFTHRLYRQHPYTSYICMHHMCIIYAHIEHATSTHTSRQHWNTLHIPHMSYSLYALYIPGIAPSSAFIHFHTSYIHTTYKMYTHNNTDHVCITCMSFVHIICRISLSVGLYADKITLSSQPESQPQKVTL